MLCCVLVWVWVVWVRRLCCSVGQGCAMLMRAVLLRCYYGHHTARVCSHGTQRAIHGLWLNPSGSYDTGASARLLVGQGDTRCLGNALLGALAISSGFHLGVSPIWISFGLGVDMAGHVSSAPLVAFAGALTGVTLAVPSCVFAHVPAVLVPPAMPFIHGVWLLHATALCIMAWAGGL